MIDYSISSEKGFKLLTNFEISELDRLVSDGHSLFIMALKFTPQIDMTIQNLSNDSITKKARQNDIKCQKMETTKCYYFKENITSSLIEQINENLSMAKLNPTQDKIDIVARQIAQVFQTAAKQIPGNISKHGPQKHAIQIKTPWFGYQCNKAKFLYNKARKRFQLHKNSVNRRSLLYASKQYKKTMNKFIYKYKAGQQSKLRKMHNHAPKEYWKYLNSINRKKTLNQPSIGDLYEFYKNLNASDNSDPDIILDENINKT